MAEFSIREFETLLFDKHGYVHLIGFEDSTDTLITFIDKNSMNEFYNKWKYFLRFERTNNSCKVIDNKDDKLIFSANSFERSLRTMSGERKFDTVADMWKLADSVMTINYTINL